MPQVRQVVTKRCNRQQKLSLILRTAKPAPFLSAAERGVSSNQLRKKMKLDQLLMIAILSLGISACSNKNEESASYQVLDKTVYFYSTSWCPYCKKARDFMDEQGIDYIEYDIDEDISAKIKHEELLGNKKKPGKVGVPLFVVNGKVLQGFSEKRLVNAVAALN